MIKKIIWVVLVAIMASFLLFPVMEYTALFDVDVAFSIREPNPVDHMITLDGQTFQIPAGQTINRIFKLGGGGTSYMLFETRGWGFPKQRLLVDGHEIDASRIRSYDWKGNKLILGIGRNPSMKVEIKMALVSPPSYTVKVLQHEKNYFAEWGEVDGKPFEDRYDAVVCDVLSGKEHICNLAVYQHWFKKDRKNYPSVGSEFPIRQYDFKEQMFTPVRGIYTMELDEFEKLKMGVEPINTK